MLRTKLKRWPDLKNTLLISRVYTGLMLLAAFVFSIELIGKTYDVAVGAPEVRLALHTAAPNGFTAAHDLNAGFEDGSHGRPHRPDRGPLPGLRAGTAGYELAADPREPLLRYREPAAWKRVALLLLGAADSTMSLPWVLLIGAGSWLLWGLLRDVTPETPFTLANARRLSRLALLVLGLALWEHLAYLLVRALVPAFGDPGLPDTLNHYVRLNTENTLPGYATAIMLTVIAVVYRRGVALSQEAELVI